MTVAFLSRRPSVEDYWRSVILFGRNVASYKFALGQALLELKPQSGRLLKLEDLALPYAKAIANHINGATKQGTFQSSRFLDACRRYNGQPDDGRLVEETVRFGFNNVIDAFHVVGPAPIDRRFFVDERATARGIRITDEFSALTAGTEVVSLPDEVESRWRLVETAWELGLTPSLVAYDPTSTTGDLVVDTAVRRKSVTSARAALNGYQKGRCFYCFADIALEKGDLFPDVDHFLPHALTQAGIQQVGGIWNLVLACRECNRGVRGKFHQIPSELLVERLHRRNEFLIESHHPLRETLMNQTGEHEPSRRAFLGTMHGRARSVLIHLWEPTPRGMPLF